VGTAFQWASVLVLLAAALGVGLRGPLARLPLGRLRRPWPHHSA
jgi:predicted small lipoprotein YifL